MPIRIRKAGFEDVPAIEKLITAYMRETSRAAWGGNAELLERHLIENDIEIFLAETSDGQTIGFLAWILSYDLHWCMKGGAIIDLYVAPPYRSRGVAVSLAVTLASEIQKRGGTHLKGGAVENPIVHKLYRRIAMSLGGNEYHVSGRAFRHLANQLGRNLREIVKNLPQPEWNHEP